MKHSSGRARSAATLAASTFGGVVGGATFEAARTLALRVTVAAALAVVPLASAYAQKAAVMPQGPAVRDNTPEIDTSIEQKNWQAALTQLDARIASNPHDAQARFKRGTVLAHLGRDDEAITAFIELTQLYPELPEPYNNLATLYAKHGRLSEARAALETAVQVNPNYGLAYENLGDVYLRMANEAYRRAQGLGKASATTTQRLADIQKIITPPAARKSAQPAAATLPDDYTARATSNMTQTPSFQFGGANGSLAMPPYMAPSH
ncbi:tetratricopeptide repeat protein [Paraburkholderia sp. Ac-20336]|uniref:tetratricopeptide repeat protein n=1 Tax=Burkholderiaceae TaxID=119060 RepID=UPI0014204952|nr:MULTISPECIES: tetratricopeptide repeat protein [Burkholderiaceae]MBN3805198.1 tetratricopeptide repeat protein [Paraburkholderia sp. Ac-20336]MBN3851607.1 tetratricopeptide repeat protein [Paraburkholderia sp. Ac-20342]NIF54397.1 tetratricopeptide repeat protein [Burkholderia sp. Ax-1724]NIF81847.1 tetratricopeptide repeat protein [Paraburkholderia sp. Cy-641]